MVGVIKFYPRTFGRDCLKGFERHEQSGSSMKCTTNEKIDGAIVLRGFAIGEKVPRL